MVEEGADMIDIGGESTRPGHIYPGHTYVDSEEEIRRVVPVIKALKKEISLPMSIDTYKADVAEEALKLGVEMVNDVWGLRRDENMANVIAKYDAEVCIMHNQDGTEYDKDIMESIKDFLNESIKMALDAGVKKEKIVLDPGIGFGKTFEQNLEVLRRLGELRDLGYPILLGTSRKSVDPGIGFGKTFEQNLEVLRRLGELRDLGYPILLGTSRKSVIGNVLHLEPKDRVEGTVATTVLGIRDGVDIVRVHDVTENLRAAKMADAIYR